MPVLPVVKVGLLDQANRATGYNLVKKIQDESQQHNWQQVRVKCWEGKYDTF